ncbi:hypothetical protein [Streptomyces sp. NPDC047108]|uniref:hypothetical protein n=1 Tax=Streptomyces sp. NPDC047108 TaxID=3155025 RepID=UPI00340672C8
MTHGQQPETEVTVTLSECTRRDAAAVLDVLYACYLSDDATPPDRHGTATVWTATLDIARPRASLAPTRLDAPVVARILGSHASVDYLEQVLTEAFVVHDEGGASGDQEKDVQLRLQSG